jgi:hypothetical protein
MGIAELEPSHSHGEDSATWWRVAAIGAAGHAPRLHGSEAAVGVLVVRRLLVGPPMSYLKKVALPGAAPRSSLAWDCLFRWLVGGQRWGC